MKYDPFAIPVAAIQRFTAYHLLSAVIIAQPAGARKTQRDSRCHVKVIDTAVYGIKQRK